MAKTSEKAAGVKQPDNQRGKSRFGAQPRSHRVVLPDRPPREVDSEIVSILLGGDPSSLAAQPLVASNEPTPQTVTTHQTRNENAETALPAQARLRDETPNISDAADPIFRQVEGAPASLSNTEGTNSRVSHKRISPVLEAPAATTSKVESVSPVSTRAIPSRNTSPPLSGVTKKSAFPAESSQNQDLSISSFEEFVERWKHGLRKGQLKVCEVLYQKTYAAGETECVTSFSELGRLSGLKMRQCFNIISQLEALKFVERAKSETTSNKKDQGSIIRFYLFPKT